MRMRASALTAALAICLALPLAGCSDRKESLARTSAEQSSGGGTTSASADASKPSSGDGSTRAASTEYAVDDPGHFKAPLRTPDVLVTSSKTIPDDVRKRVAQVDGVRASLP